jgi:hypothetical protein
MMGYCTRINSKASVVRFKTLSGVGEYKESCLSKFHSVKYLVGWLNKLANDD